MKTSRTLLFTIVAFAVLCITAGVSEGSRLHAGVVLPPPACNTNNVGCWFDYQCPPAATCYCYYFWDWEFGWESGCVGR